MRQGGGDTKCGMMGIDTHLTIRDDVSAFHILLLRRS